MMELNSLLKSCKNWNICGLSSAWCMEKQDTRSQELVERSNGNTKEVLMEWMADNNSWNWSMGIHFMRFAKNSAHHSGINHSLYSALSGANPGFGITSTSLPSDIINCLNTEEDLVSVLTCRASSPVPRAHAAPEHPTGIEAVTEPAPRPPLEEIHPQPVKPPLAQTLQTCSLLPTESMASAQPLATPACKADLWFQQQGKGAQAGQASQVEQGKSAPRKRACGQATLQLATREPVWPSPRLSKGPASKPTEMLQSRIDASTSLLTNVSIMKISVSSVRKNVVFLTKAYILRLCCF